MIDIETLDRLRRLFRRFPEVKIAYLFGSHAKGNTGPLSDIDIAYVFDPRIKETLYRDLELEASISKVLGIDNVDCYLLNKMPLQFQYEVITTGKVIYVEDDSFRKRYEERIKKAFSREKGKLVLTKEDLLKTLGEIS